MNISIDFMEDKSKLEFAVTKPVDFPALLLCPERIPLQVTLEAGYTAEDHHYLTQVKSLPLLPSKFMKTSSFNGSRANHLIIQAALRKIGKAHLDTLNVSANVLQYRTFTHPMKRSVFLFTSAYCFKFEDPINYRKEAELRASAAVIYGVNTSKVFEQPNFLVFILGTNEVPILAKVVNIAWNSQSFLHMEKKYFERRKQTENPCKTHGADTNGISCYYDCLNKLLNTSCSLYNPKLEQRLSEVCFNTNWNSLQLLFSSKVSCRQKCGGSCAYEHVPFYALTMTKGKGFDLPSIFELHVFLIVCLSIYDH